MAELESSAHVYRPEHSKVSKSTAGYENPAKGEEHCGICKFYEQIEPEHCSRVKGVIESVAWCKLFVRHEAFAK